LSRSSRASHHHTSALPFRPIYNLNTTHFKRTAPPRVCIQYADSKASRRSGITGFTVTGLLSSQASRKPDGDVTGHSYFEAQAGAWQWREGRQEMARRRLMRQLIASACTPVLHVSQKMVLTPVRCSLDVAWAFHDRIAQYHYCRRLCVTWGPFMHAGGTRRSEHVQSNVQLSRIFGRGGSCHEYYRSFDRLRHVRELGLGVVFPLQTQAGCATISVQNN
jgi:hypothetical protein